MKFLFHSICLQHDTGPHPENAGRLAAFRSLPEMTLQDGTEHLELVHTPAYIEHVRKACENGTPLDPDTRTSPESWAAALHAVGAAVLASESGDFALVRPPGHHAHAQRAGGFCLFNNLAIAVRRLERQGKRVFILDFDGHLGDGTSAIFFDSDQVLFLSLHQYPAFPGHGFPHEIGAEAGMGYTLNLPLSPGTGDDIFRHALENLLPIAEAFEPDVVAVSAGFDAHQNDPLLQLRLTNTTYHFIGRLLRERFPFIFAVLEGGYDPEALHRCARNFLAGVNGEAAPFQEPETQSDLLFWSEYERNLEALQANLQPYWKR